MYSKICFPLLCYPTYRKLYRYWTVRAATTSQSGIIPALSQRFNHPGFRHSRSLQVARSEKRRFFSYISLLETIRRVGGCNILRINTGTHYTIDVYATWCWFCSLGIIRNHQFSHHLIRRSCLILWWMTAAFVWAIVNNEETIPVAATTTTTTMSSFQSMIMHSIVGVPLLTLLYYCCIEAYHIRLYALKEYGLIIHEFDPYFNYRATEVRYSAIGLVLLMMMMFYYASFTVISMWFL